MEPFIKNRWALPETHRHLRLHTRLLWLVVFFVVAEALRTCFVSALDIQQGVAAPLTPADILADMKRSNEAESDHRKIMTPEFRAFCIASREHVVCSATFLILFICAYIAVRRACTRPSQIASGSCRWRRAWRLDASYSTMFRSRQMAIVVAAMGLAAAAMTALLLAVTVGLANAMEHDDPQRLGAWRLWLLPATLMGPSDAQQLGMAGHGVGPHVAHDFPPILRRLWLYQSIISVGAATVVLPLGILFEHTSPQATIRRRLLVAFVRWVAMAAAAFGAWEAACHRSSALRRLGFYRPLSRDGATMRYSIHYASCMFGLLPAVLVIMPRGTWALFNWLRSCVSQRHELAQTAHKRSKRLTSAKTRIERQLRQAIGSWKWRCFHDSDDSLWFSDLEPEPGPRPAPISSHSAARLPPAHPGLAQQTKFQTVAARRPNASLKHRAGRTALPPSTLQMESAAPDGLYVDGNISPHSPVLYYSDNLDSSDDGLGDAQKRRIAERAQRRLRRAREREMQDLSRKIKQYHAQLVYISNEMSRIDASGILANSHSSEIPKSGAWALIAAAKAPALLVMTAAVFCWLLVVLQVGRGALSAIFVGEPDLTSSFTYFMPALVSSRSSEHAAAGGKQTQGELNAASNPTAMLPLLITMCQLVSGLLLFVVVLFGVQAMRFSVEGSVLPVRAAAASHVDVLMQARLWAWLPPVLLPTAVLKSIDPLPAAQQQLPLLRVVAGNTSRMFFSSSSDLTSFYRQLQGQTTLTAMPTDLELDSALSDGLFQARALGARVFLLLNARRPISLRQLLTYAWIVCVLAMSWPSVLRATGLISERAYVLPVASLVEPLWTPYELDEEELVLQPNVLENAHLANMQPASSFLPGLTSTCSLPGYRDKLSDVFECPSAASATPDMGVNSIDRAISDAPSHRKISRRQLLLSLTEETLPRRMVRWLLQLSARVSAQLSVSLAWCVWWADPDLIVPLSKDTVDMQLGYIRPPLSGLPIMTFGTSPQFSEWYGMLQRLQRSAVRLPQASDGTPLVLRASGESIRMDQAFVGADDSLMPETLAQSARNVFGYAATTTLVFCRAWVRVTLLRLWNAILGCASGLCAAVSPSIYGSQTATAVSNAMVSAVTSAVVLVWRFLLRPLLWHASLMVSGLARVASFLFALVLSVSDRAAARSSTDGLQAVGAESMGVGDAIPSLFLAAFWDSAAAHSGAALQRLRPELWTHVLKTNSVHFVYDTMPPPPSTPEDSDANAPHSLEKPLVTAGADEGRPQMGPVRAVWTTLDVALAVYRVVLGMLACRAVFGPSRSSRPFAL
ncbi:hypothetical protein IWW36_002098 [Coemansia brasiliensis]|uniref:Uncharacterized protein n=1 Tax=Coemansia brasiliensis TaxID=2650707 RepID=A0A9W8ICN8_9FUNG|nr:hypothetical protein IWW36_002098 [Coemansia brasiliensis]